METCHYKEEIYKSGNTKTTKYTIEREEKDTVGSPSLSQTFSISKTLYLKPSLSQKLSKSQTLHPSISSFLSKRSLAQFEHLFRLLHYWYWEKQLFSCSVQEVWNETKKSSRSVEKKREEAARKITTINQSINHDALLKATTSFIIKYVKYKNIKKIKNEKI